MESSKSVEWQLVDYGSGIFHVASYQDGAGSQAPAVVESIPEIPVEKPEHSSRECILYRCWVAMCDGVRAA